MKGIPFLIILTILVIFPMANGVTLTTHEREAIFLDCVTQAITKKDNAAFRALYCDQSESRLPALFSVHAKSRFTGARLKPPREEVFKGIAYDYILTICIEPPETKEMCELFPVKNGKEGLCILNNEQKGRKT